MPRTPHPDDQMFCDLPVAGEAAFLVTGDRAMLGMPVPDGLLVMSPEGLRSALPDEL